jgi:hypothetical protein
MSRYLRYLRIAFSVTCGIACVLVVVVWMRSYWVSNQVFLQLGNSPAFGLVSAHGALVFGYEESGYYGTTVDFREMAYNDDHWIIWYEGEQSSSGFNYVPVSGGLRVYLPYWTYLVAFAVFATAPWLHHIHYRFSLRTLLIGMTVVAAILGLVVWAGK